MANSLPEGFEDLEPFVDDWALATQAEREVKRRGASRQELADFYNIAFAQVPRILQMCDEFPLGTLPTSHQPLFSLSLMVAEVAPHVENYGGSPKVPHAFDETRFHAAHGTHETWKAQPPSRG